MSEKDPAIDPRIARELVTDYIKRDIRANPKRAALYAELLGAPLLGTLIEARILEETRLGIIVGDGSYSYQFGDLKMKVRTVKYKDKEARPLHRFSCSAGKNFWESFKKEVAKVKKREEEAQRPPRITVESILRDLERARMTPRALAKLKEAERREGIIEHFHQTDTERFKARMCREAKSAVAERERFEKGDYDPVDPFELPLSQTVCEEDAEFEV